MSELDEDVELTLERKQAILDLFHRLDELSYYEILGVPIAADKKDIKRAYYELAPEFHPDKYFRKRLGSFKPKIETIFARITLAHDVLTHKTRRAEYDTYLEQVLKNRAMAAWMDQAPPSAPPSGGAPRPAASAAPAPTPPAQVPPAPGPAPAEQPQPRAAADPESAAEIDRIRRQTLARKLAGGLRRLGSGVVPAVSPNETPPTPTPPPARPSAPSMPATPPPAAPSWSSAAPGASSELEQLLRAAAAASARGDFVGEADALRAALSLAPLNSDIRRRSREAQVRAAGALAHGYLKQADYEAGEARWVEASWSYAKAASLLPREARPHERVAFATLAMGGSPQRAVEFARRAVELAPTETALRITLGRAYLAAGQEATALAELEEARARAPDDLRVQALAAELIEQVRRRAR